MENMVGPTVYSIYPHRCGTAVKPIVYLLLIMASTEPQKLLFWCTRWVPLGSQWSEYVTTTNFHVKNYSSGKNKSRTVKFVKNN